MHQAADSQRRSTKSQRWSAALCLLLSLVSSPAAAQYPEARPAPQEVRTGFSTISTEDERRILTYLATQCEGRGTGQRGFEKAARFVAREFGKIGLKPLGDDGTYFQH